MSVSAYSWNRAILAVRGEPQDMDEVDVDVERGPCLACRTAVATDGKDHIAAVDVTRPRWR